MLRAIVEIRRAKLLGLHLGMIGSLKCEWNESEESGRLFVAFHWSILAIFVRWRHEKLIFSGKDILKRETTHIDFKSLLILFEICFVILFGGYYTKLQKLGNNSKIEKWSLDQLLNGLVTTFVFNPFFVWLVSNIFQGIGFLSKLKSI